MSLSLDEDVDLSRQAGFVTLKVRAGLVLKDPRITRMSQIKEINLFCTDVIWVIRGFWESRGHEFLL